MKNSGFSLSEVLIVLGVIGVISAITLPIISANYQKQRTVNKLKKVYTVLNQAYKMSEIDNGSFENWDISGDRETYVKKYWQPYLKVVKTCKGSLTCGGYQGNTNHPWVKPNNTELGYGINGYNIILNDGTFLIISNANQRISADLNAGAKPNKLGRDFFVFQVTNNGVYPYGHEASYSTINYHCSKTTGTGEFCAAKIMHDGWKILNNYPW